MSYKIISDSSADMLSMEGVAFESVPLKIITSEKEYVDNAQLDVGGMIGDLQKYKGISKSSCPNSQEWQDAFDGHDYVFCVTITSGLSGSFNAARLAVEEYMQKNPGKKSKK